MAPTLRKFLYERASATLQGIRKNPLPPQKPKNPNYNPAAGSVNPHHVNNHAIFALFALLGVAMVLTGMWFFFHAKNGGFVWRKGDWEEYKSTVLRRKGPNGKTLSNATPRTDLGGRSIAGTWDNQTVRNEKWNSHKPYRDDIETGTPRRYERTRQPSHPKRSSHQHDSHGINFNEHVDNDVEAYRREQPARIGGLNRASDGSNFDIASGYSSGTPSVVSNNSRTHLTGTRNQEPKGKVASLFNKQREWRAAAMANRARTGSGGAAGVGANRKRTDKVNEQRGHHGQRQNREKTASGRVRPSQQRSNETLADRLGARNTRSAGPNRAAAHRAAEKRNSNPMRAHRTPGSFDAYSEAGSDESGGTRSYSHHIPGLSARPGLSGLGNPTTANRTTSAGYRRDAFGGRRDSLSDSDLD